MTALLDITGQQFGRLTVVEYVGDSRWRSACECGNENVAQGGDLRAGKVKSCGCFRTDVIRAVHGSHSTHGMTRTPTWRSWVAMKTRCSNPNTIGWQYYGGRGITICDRWMHSFENFLTDMGVKPAGCSLDRIDSDGNYEPSNCRWATATQQANNRRKVTP